MTNQVIDNSSDAEFGKIILWQYDNAENLIETIKSFLGIYNVTTRDLWNKYQEEIDVDRATDYGLSILGTLIGFNRTTLKDGSSISIELYRRMIKARFQLSLTGYTIKDINKYLDTVFEGHVNCIDNYDMSLSYTYKDENLTAEELELITTQVDYCLPFPAAVRIKDDVEWIIFGFDGQQFDPGVGGFDDSTFQYELDDNQFIPENERYN